MVAACRFLFLFFGFASCFPISSFASEANPIVICGESRNISARLDEIKRSIQEGKNEIAIPMILALIDSSKNELSPVDTFRSVSGRTLAHSLLMRAPENARKAYLQRIEKGSFSQVKSLPARESETLINIFQEQFPSKKALSCLDFLGNKSFAEGRLDEAQDYWQLISPWELTERGKLDHAFREFPGLEPSIKARTQAKQLLARFFDSSLKTQDLELFQEKHPQIKGKLAGREGTLEEILRDICLPGEQPPPPKKNDWVSFGGSSSRNLVSHGGPRFLEHLSRICRSGPTWVFDLEKRSLTKTVAPGPNPGEELETAKRLAFYPILLGHHAIVSDARYITAYDLKTGNVEVWYDAGKWVGGLRSLETLPGSPDLRYSLTYSNNRIYARMGTQTIRDIRPDPVKSGRPGMKGNFNGESILVCLSSQPGEKEDRRRWMVRGTDESNNYFAVFEGAPLVHGDRVYIASTRFDGDRVITAIHCYPAEVEDSVAPLLWKTDVCETRELLPATSESDLQKKQRFRHHLLTMAGSRIVYCSHSGAIVALDGLTGQREWARRYPRKEIVETEDESHLSELCPAIYAERKLFVAPSDSDYLYCLDPVTGAVIWERTKLDPVHLAGVGNGNLIFTTWGNQGSARRYSGGLRAVQSDSGSDKGGWIIPGSGGGVLPFGRPILIDDLVLWPTYRLPFGVYAIRQKDGLQPDNPSLLHRVVSGNLLWANQSLLVTTATSLYAYILPEGLSPESQSLSWQAERKDLNSLSHRVDNSSILSHIDVLEKRWISKLPSHSVHKIIEDIRRRKHLLCIHSLQGNSPENLEKNLINQCKCEDPCRRLNYHLLLANKLRSAGNSSMENRVWEQLLSDSENRNEIIKDERGVPQRVDWIASRELAKLGNKSQEIKAKGPNYQMTGKLKKPTNLDVFLDTGESYLPLEGACWNHPWFLTKLKRETRCRSRIDGHVIAKFSLSFDPNWACLCQQKIVVCGNFGIACLDPYTKEMYWFFPAYKSAAFPRDSIPELRTTTEGSHKPTLRSFTLIGKRLIFLRGERELLGMSITDGAVEWLWHPSEFAHDSSLNGLAIRQVRRIEVGRILVQSRDFIWLLNPETGKVISKTFADPGKAIASVVPLNNNTYAVIPNPYILHCFHSIDGRLLWTHRAPSNFNINHDMPLLFDGSDFIFLIKQLNIGYQLSLIDKKTGAMKRSETVVVSGNEWNPNGWQVDNSQLYYFRGGRLDYWSLSDGSRHPPFNLPTVNHHSPVVLKNHLVIPPENDRQFNLSASFLFFRWETKLGPVPNNKGLEVTCIDLKGNLPVLKIDMDSAFHQRQDKPAFGKYPVMPSFRAEMVEKGSELQVSEDEHHLCLRMGNRIQFVTLNGVHQAKKDASCQQ